MISSVVAHLQSPSTHSSTLRAIQSHPDIEVGQRYGNHLPMVLETADARDSEDLLRWLSDLPDVAFVDVAYVHFDAADQQTSDTETDLV